MKLLAAVLLLIASAGGAQAATPKTAAPARLQPGVPSGVDACPQPVDGGCAASLGGNFIQPSFNTYAPQSGQTWSAWGRVNWNACGIYARCGYYTPTAQLRDPATANPKGCTYQPAGSTSGGPLETCAGPVVDIEHFDFSLHNCVPVRILATATSIKIWDVKFASGSNCAREDYFGNGSMLIWGDNAASADLDMEYVSADGGGSPGVKGLGTCFLFYLADGHNATIRHSDIHNCDNQPIQLVGGGGKGALHVLSQFNYYENMVFTSGLHGESIMGTSTAGTWSYESDFDTVLQGAGVKQSGSTACIYITPGQGGPAVSSAVIDHLLCVINLNRGQVTTAWAASAGTLPAITYGRISITNSAVDDTGAYGDWDLGGARCTTHPATLSGNFRLTTGAPINTWSVNQSTNC